MRAIRIVILAKAPLPGFAKTRLVPALGANATALLAAKMIQHSVSNAVDAGLGNVEMCVTPVFDSRHWRELELPEHLIWSDQPEGDLGNRMESVVRRTIAHGESVLLMGTDCIELTSDIIQQAAASLLTHDACMVPVIDGGYALLGLNYFNECLFRDIPWSTGNVASLTQNRIAELGWRLKLFPPLHDIDDPADLRWLPYRWRKSIPAGSRALDPFFNNRELP